MTKKHDPRAGTCRWVLPIGEVGTSILAINGTNDTVMGLRGPDGVAGFQMVKAD